MTERKLTLFQRVSVWTESLLMTFLVPKERVGGFFGLLFKLPQLFRKLGLGFLIPRNILILTTTGRRSGLPRHTPMEFSPGPEPGVLLVMSGWEGRTDWCRNLRADPRVRVWRRGREYDAVAEAVPDADVARLLREVTQINPSAARMWSRWSPVPVDGSEAAWLAAAPHFPCFYLRPVTGHIPEIPDPQR